MSLEWLVITIWLLLNIFALLTAIFAILVVFNLKRQIHKKMTHMHRSLMRIFILIAAGLSLISMSILIWNFCGYVGMEFLEFSLIDIPFISGYILVISGFSYCWFKFYKRTSEKGRIMATMVVLAVLSFAILFHLITYIILPYNPNYGLFTQVSNIVYPTLTIFLFLSSIIVYFMFRQGTVKIPFLLLALSALAVFAGDVLYYSYPWEGGYDLVDVFSGIFYLMAYVFSTVSFYLLFKKSSMAVTGK